ncbi:MAG TPA: TetR/AcrR family transcriptional regulator [Saccharofermentans sp.]|nr:TetR/AcrR family transcriptional regulator [Saccharofermentans sp.]
MRQGADTKEKILQTALVAFSRYGYEGARMEKIASEVGINKASLYFHFKSKEEIFRVLFSRIVEKYEASLTRMLENANETTVYDRLVSFYREYLLYHWQNPEMDFWNHVYYLPPESMKAEIIDVTGRSKDSLMEGLSDILTEGVRTGELQKLPVESMAMSFYYLLTCISISTDMMDKDEYLSNMDSCFAVYWNGIRAVK